MKRLLQINVDANNGSNGSIARDIGTMALNRGWESMIAYGRRAIPCDSQLIKVGSDLDVKIHGLQTRMFDNHGRGSYFTTKVFLKKVDKFKPDIVHLHNIHGYYINYELLFNYLVEKQIPVVWTLHDCWPFTGHCGYFVKWQCVKWLDGCYNCPASHTYPKSWFIDNSKDNYNVKKCVFTAPSKMHLTTVSNWLKGLVEKSFLSNFPITVIYDGIDVDEFKSRPSDLRIRLGLENKFILLAAAANWSESKGWSDYIELSKLLTENYTIVLVGVEKISKQKLPDHIVCIPRQESKSDLADYYSMADVLLSLSYQETFGMTIAEALACGTPAIVYNNTACPEVISADCGIAVESGNLGEVLGAIKVISSKKKDFYSNACRQRVIECFNSKTVNEQFFDIYESFY